MEGNERPPSFKKKNFSKTPPGAPGTDQGEIFVPFPGWGGVFLALFLYNFLFPGNQVTETEVANAIAGALASATPRPAYSVQVYQAIQPSLVMIESEFGSENIVTDRGLGSGVIVDDTGNILTSLHVVDTATRIVVTFADGTR